VQLELPKLLQADAPDAPVAIAKPSKVVNSAALGI
jgi:hypothetical protein